MKIFLKILAALLALLVVVVLAAVIWVQASYERDFSSTPLPSIKASTDPAVIARGEYVANAVAHCSACHEPGYYVAKNMLTTDLRDLRGGFTFHAGPFGTFHAANLTADAETGLGRLSDGQIARAIRHGIDRNGGFAVFMALSVGVMADEDLTAVVSYLRTLPAKRNPVARDQWGFIAKALAHAFKPHAEAIPSYVAPGGTSVERGQYLANGPAGCYTCHSERAPLSGFDVVGVRFAGNPQPDPDDADHKMENVAPNLTPDLETGRTGMWTEDAFLMRIRAGRAVKGSRMPWESFARMTDDDLRSIYRYLHSLPAVKRDLGPTHRPAGWKKS